MDKAATIYTNSCPFGEHKYGEYRQIMLQINNFYFNRQHLKSMTRYLLPLSPVADPGFALEEKSWTRHWYAR